MARGLWPLFLLAMLLPGQARAFFDSGFEPVSDNLALIEAIFEGQGQAGLPYRSYATVMTTKAVTQKIVNLVLVPFDPLNDDIGALDPFQPSTPWEPVGAFTIDFLDAGESIDIDIVAQLSNEFPPGIYVPIVLFDAIGQTDHAANEVDRTDDFRVASAPITIAAPLAQSALEIVMFESQKPFFFDQAPEVPMGDEDPNGMAPAIEAHISAHLALQVFGVSLASPVDAVFEVRIPSAVNPGTTDTFVVDVLDPGAATPQLVAGYQFDVESSGFSFQITEDMPVWPPPEDHTPAWRGITLDLALPDAAVAALAAHGKDVDVIVQVNVGAPANDAAVFSIRYLAADPVSSTAKDDGGAQAKSLLGVTYPTSLVNLGTSGFYGQSSPAGAGYGLGILATARSLAQGSPAAYGQGRANVYIKLFGNTVTLLDGYALGHLTTSGGDFRRRVSALGIIISDLRYVINDSSPLFQRSVTATYSRTKSYTKRFTIGPIPASIRLKGTATGGVTGSVTGSLRVLSFSAGPLIDINGTIEFSAIDLGLVSAGVGGSLNIIEVTNIYGVSFNRSVSNVLTMSYSGPITFKTLSGRLYAFVNVNYLFGSTRYSINIVSWSGYTTSYNWFSPRTLSL